MRHAINRSLVAAALLLAWSPRPSLAGDVTIYRCVDAKGKLTLRDTPCAAGELQETRTMPRPKDAAPRPPARRPAAPQSDYVEPPRVVVAYPPRPMYECVNLDDERYTSDNAEGNPRWVPLWTLGYEASPRIADFRMGARRAGVSGGRPIDPTLAYGTGTWIRDPCYALPQGEVCNRLIDRRDEIRRRFFNAMPSERDVLRVEERGVNARLANDCGVH